MRKRSLSLILALCVAVVFVACTPSVDGSGTGGGDKPGGQMTSEYPTAIPSYEMFKDERQLEHVAFWTPPPTDQHYQWLAESGMTQIVVDAKYDVLPQSEKMETVLSLCEKYGITAYPAINREANLQKGDFAKFFKYDSFGGFYTDEPLTKEHLDKVFQNADNAFGSVNYKYDTLITLIQNAPEGYDDYFQTMEQYYEYFGEHMRGKTSKYGFDIYPLNGNGYKSSIASNWLYAMNTAATYADKYDFDFYSFISTMSIRSQSVRRPAYDDLSYTIWVSLAYGAKGIEYFCYNSPGGPPYSGEFNSADWAMLYIDDQYYGPMNSVEPENYDKYYRTETYYNVQKLTQEFAEFDHVLLSFDWTGTLVNAGTEAATSAGDCFTHERSLGDEKFVPLDKHKRIKSMTSTEDLIIGTFNDGNGYDGFMAVNFADPFYDLSNSVELNFNSASKALVYSKKGREIVQLENGKFATTLNPGEGCFIIPIA